MLSTKRKAAEELPASSKEAKASDDVKTQLRKQCECPICCDLMAIATTLQCCGQSLCAQCIHKARKYSDKCPMCSQAVGQGVKSVAVEGNVKLYLDLFGSEEEKKSHAERSSKHFDQPAAAAALPPALSIEARLDVLRAEADRATAFARAHPDSVAALQARNDAWKALYQDPESVRLRQQNERVARAARARRLAAKKRFERYMVDAEVEWPNDIPRRTPGVEITTEAIQDWNARLEAATRARVELKKATYHFNAYRMNPYLTWPEAVPLRIPPRATIEQVKGWNALLKKAAKEQDKKKRKEENERLKNEAAIDLTREEAEWARRAQPAAAAIRRPCAHCGRYH